MVPLYPQQFRPANKRTPPLIKSQQPPRLLRDSHPPATPNPPSTPRSLPQPQHTFPAQIHTIQPLVNSKGLRQTPRPTCQIHQTLRPAKLFHLRDALERLSSPQQNSFANPLPLPRNI